MLYAFLHGLARIVFYFFFRCRVKGAENLIEEGGFIVAPNHRSGLDIPLVAMALPRRMYSIGKKELFSNKITGSFLKSLGGFPLDRGSIDLSALKKAIDIVRSGNILLMFPEGTRSEKGNLQKGKKGTVFIATNSKVPIIPAGITGTEKAFPKGAKLPRFHSISICFGKPFRPWEVFDPKDKDYLEKATEFLMEEISKCIRKIKEK